MIMHGPQQRDRIEARWPLLLTILVVFVLMLALPQRVRLMPYWVPYATTIALLTPICAVALSNGNARWIRIERVVILVFCALSVLGNVATLAFLIDQILARAADVGGVQLLTSSVAIWVLNVLGFALLYWRADRRSCVGESGADAQIHDWLFPQDSLGDQIAPGWRATFVDYLWLSFSTATAFSATEVAPLTPRAKLLMMLESSLSLATIVVVASRAINVLGG